MKNIKFMPLFALILFFFAGNIFAQPKERCLPRISSLTEEQKTAINNLCSEHQTKMIDLKAELEKTKLEVTKFLSEGNYSKEQHYNLEKRVVEIQTQMHLERIKQRTEVFSLLDEKQRNYLKSNQMKKENKKKERMDKKLKERKNSE